MRGRAIAVGLAALAAVALVLWLGRDRERERGPTGAPERPAAPAAAQGPSNPRSPPPAAFGAVPAAPDGGSVAARVARWRALLGAVKTAQERRVRAARTARPDAPPAEDAVGTLDRDTIRKGIQGMKELLAECYDLARRDAPTLAGRLVVEFTLIGEPGVGAVVEQSQVDPESELGTNATLVECVRETIMTLELEAPPQGGRVLVRYPFVFATEPPPSEAPAATRN